MPSPAHSGFFLLWPDLLSHPSCQTEVSISGLSPSLPLHLESHSSPDPVGKGHLSSPRALLSTTSFPLHPLLPSPTELCTWLSSHRSPLGPAGRSGLCLVTEPCSLLSQPKGTNSQPGVVAHAYHSSIQEAEQKGRGELKVSLGSNSEIKAINDCLPHTGWSWEMV